MTLLLASTLKVSALLLLALGAIAVMRSRSAAARHWVLAVAIGCAMATPLASLIVPPWHVSVAQARAVPTIQPVSETISVRLDVPARPARLATASVGEGRTLAPAHVLGLIWLLGVFVSLATLTIGVWRLHALTAQSHAAEGRWIREAQAVARAYGLQRPVRILHTDHPTLLVTFGWRRHTVLLPAAAHEWSDDRIHVVVSHELAHIARGDWAIQWLAELLRSLYWFNPLVWLACQRLRQESEYACDDEVLKRGVGGATYATHLVDLARALRTQSPIGFPAPAMARPSTLRKRISAMLNARLDRTPLTRSARLVTLVALLAITIPIATFGSQVFGTIVGTVIDSTGGIMPDATLTLSNAETRAKHEVRTDGTGAFRFVGLPAGDYVLEVRTIGFADLRQELTLAAGKDLQVPVTMQVATLQETITVVKGPGFASLDREPARRRAAVVTEQPQCTPGAVGGNIKVPHKLVDVRPRYPESLEAQAPTSVVLEARIGTDGHVKDARAVAAVDPEVERAASEAVMQWQFTPTLLNCVPIEVNMTVMVTFKPERN